MNEMSELEKSYWDWFMIIKLNRFKMAMLPLDIFLIQPVVQEAIKKLGELHRELDDGDLWQKF